MILMVDMKESQVLDQLFFTLQVIAQYTAFKIQHEHDMTLTQRSPEYAMALMCINVFQNA